MKNKKKVNHPSLNQLFSFGIGSQDICATDSHYARPRGIFRPISDYPEFSHWPTKSIYDVPSAPSERIHVPGYRYDPLHRDTYGYSPRAIYPHNYPSTASLDRYRPGKLSRY